MRLWLWRQGDDHYVSSRKPRKNGWGEWYCDEATDNTTWLCRSGALIFQRLTGSRFPEIDKRPVEIEVATMAKSKRTGRKAEA